MENERIFSRPEPADYFGERFSMPRHRREPHRQGSLGALGDSR
jgi:hypothetical protein